MGVQAPSVREGAFALSKPSEARATSEIEVVGGCPSAATLIITDAQLFGDALMALLASDDSVHIVGIGSPAEAIGLIRDVKHDLVLLDVDAVVGPAIVKRIMMASHYERVIALRVAEEAQVVLTWIRAGVVGCVGRSSSFDELRAVLKAVAVGEVCSSDAIARQLFRVAAAHEPHFARRSAAALTERELEIADLVAHGKSNAEIATLLQIAHATVKNHLRSVYLKLDVHRRLDVTEWWLAEAVWSSESPKRIHSGDDLGAPTLPA